MGSSGSGGGAPTGTAPTRWAAWDVPGALWIYSFLRAISFGVAANAGYGGILLDLPVVLVLFVIVLLRRRWALIALGVVEVLSLAQAAAVGFSSQEIPLLVPILQALASGTLLAPSVRRWTTRPGRPVGTAP